MASGFRRAAVGLEEPAALAPERDTDAGGIAEQLQDSRDKSGFAGVAVLPVTATDPPYLSEAYFERYGQILETCRASA